MSADQWCCFSREVLYKPQKNSKQTSVIATLPPASDPHNAKQPAPSSFDVYFVNKAKEAVKSVSFEDLWAWMVQKGAVDPNCENLRQIKKEDLILSSSRLQKNLLLLQVTLLM